MYRFPEAKILYQNINSKTDIKEIEFTAKIIDTANQIVREVTLSLSNSDRPLLADKEKCYIDNKIYISDKNLIVRNLSYGTLTAHLE